MEGNLIIDNCTLATPRGHKALRGSEMGAWEEMPGCRIIVRGGIIEYAGPASEAPRVDEKEYALFDANGHVAMPGMVDSHTHLVFGGFRPNEFGWRLKGVSYMEIMQRGGGIQSTVDATHNIDAATMAEKGRWFIDRMLADGVTTVEAKSGYGLDVETEEKMLDAIHELRESCSDRIHVVPTFLGAHAVPREYKGRTDEYIDYMIAEMLPRFKDKARFCDIFCEKNVFEIEESRRFLKAAKDMGYELKLHADEIVTLGGAELAAELGAVSADHLLHISDEGIRRLAESGTVATCLPLTAFALKEPYAPARLMIDAGCAVALATDLNPGSCFSGSIPLTIALGCLYMGMTIQEVISALTINGAAAVGMADTIGTLEPGKEANIAMLHFTTIDALPYYVGMNCVERVWFRGMQVVTPSRSLPLD
ncbi:MAG: imidazolonepropionase [Muribaculaceae bacterium]|nr:imidazolonepropionase [Muribaculaceae bacterium]